MLFAGSCSPSSGGEWYRRLILTVCRSSEAECFHTFCNGCRIWRSCSGRTPCVAPSTLWLEGRGGITERSERTGQIVFQRLTQFHRAISVFAILALFAAGIFSASAPVHAGGLTTLAPLSPPCHHSVSNQQTSGSTDAALDYCKSLCLAASPDHFVGFVIAGHELPSKHLVILIPQILIELAPLTAASVNVNYRRFRPTSPIPIYLRNQRLLI